MGDHLATGRPEVFPDIDIIDSTHRGSPDPPPPKAW
jgi:hypothetical protein